MRRSLRPAAEAPFSAPLGMTTMEFRMCRANQSGGSTIVMDGAANEAIASAASTKQRRSPKRPKEHTRFSISHPMFRRNWSGRNEKDPAIETDREYRLWKAYSLLTDLQSP